MSDYLDIAENINNEVQNKQENYDLSIINYKSEKSKAIMKYRKEFGATLAKEISLGDKEVTDAERIMYEKKRLLEAEKTKYELTIHKHHQAKQQQKIDNKLVGNW